MSLSNRDEGLLDLAVKRGLLGAAQAQAVRDRRQGRSLAITLVEDGHLTLAQVKALRVEQNRNSISANIDGYRIVSHIGNGGMSVVFKAVEQASGREVALKLLSPRIAAHGLSVPRFLREARAAASVIHPHVIRCFGSGEANGRPYQALEFMAGGDVARLLASQGGPLPEARALDIALQCARGLQGIHAEGLIHRDIKPGNIFLTADGAAKLADLGLAKSAEPDDQLTMPGTRIGTPVYMSPEQAEGRQDLDIRTDIYSLGATLYHMVTGRQPFSGANLGDVLRQVLRTTPADPRSLNPALSRPTAALIARAMARDRAARPGSPDRLVADLEAAIAGRFSGAGSGWVRQAVERVRRWCRSRLAVASP